jgi:hypothetical protein
MRRRPFAVAAVVLASILCVMLLIGWLVRFRIANAIVQRTLAEAQVPASYQITRIGPFLERMENVRMGDPAAPDLIARRIDVSIGYGLSGPTVSALRVEGVRLRAKIDAHGLSLGTIDRLMPRSQGGKTKLPDLDVALADTQVELATPNGTIRAALTGAGNPTRIFRGKAQVAAAALRLASCRLSQVAADLSIGAQGGKPSAAGPVWIAQTQCPGLTLGAGKAQMMLSASVAFDRVAMQATLAGFGGAAGPARFSGVTGSVAAAGKLGDITGNAHIGLAALALPDASRMITQAGGMLTGTPLGPTGMRAAKAIAGLLSQSNTQLQIDATIHGRGADFHLKRLDMMGLDGARLTVVERRGMLWTAQGWRADADMITGGGGLPDMAVQLRQSAPGALMSGAMRLEPYPAGEALLATSPLRFTWDGKRADFETIVTIDGPFGGGFVRGLTVPVTGYATATGAFAIGRGCQTIAFRQLLLTSFTFDETRLPVCGKPIVVQTAAGALRIAAETGPVRLTGHSKDDASMALDAARLAVTQAGFTARDLTATFGDPERQTHLSVARLDGAVRNRRLGGQFVDAAGAIANVPLDIADANGGWSMVDGALRLTGKLRVSDADTAAARFNPLMTEDAVLALNGGVISASATLREPTTHDAIATVKLAHDLAQGTGRALLDVAGVTFAPKGLQPEKLTPLTLGVIANVAGTISGRGRIDWSPKGVASSGDFGTERVDLAAAFGPVTGIKGRIHFTDLFGLVSAARQEATIAEINPGVSVANGVVHFQLIGGNRVRVEDANWPFAGGDLSLDPSTLDFGAEAERHLTFRIRGLDAAAFVQQLDFPNISATGRFDGVLPMIFDQSGGRIEAGSIVARSGGGTLAYVGELSNAQLGTMGKLAFDALKAIRYSSLDISLDGRLDGEMVSRVRFTGVREATPEQSLVTRLIRNLPFRFNIGIRAPFRGLVGSARAYIDPRLLLTQIAPAATPTPAEPPIQTPASGDRP